MLNTGTIWKVLVCLERPSVLWCSWLGGRKGHMQICTLPQTDNYASTPSLNFYGPDALPEAQPTVSKHW